MLDPHFNNNFSFYYNAKCPCRFTALILKQQVTEKDLFCLSDQRAIIYTTRNISVKLTDC